MRNLTEIRTILVYDRKMSNFHKPPVRDQPALRLIEGSGSRNMLSEVSSPQHTRETMKVLRDLFGVAVNIIDAQLRRRRIAQLYNNGSREGIAAMRLNLLYDSALRRVKRPLQPTDLIQFSVGNWGREPVQVWPPVKDEVTLAQVDHMHKMRSVLRIVTTDTYAQPPLNTAL